VNPAVVKALGALLLYPGDDLIAALPEIGALLAAEEALAPATRAELARLVEALAAGERLDLEEAYVGLFDRGSSLSLHLFEHVHGESRERGQAMIELRKIYENAGFEPTARELPDYLPLLCEFVSLAPAEKGLALLADTAPVLAGLRRRLERRESAYAAVIAALLEICGAAGDADTAPQAADDDARDELAELDRSWEEMPVTFGRGEFAEAAAGAVLPRSRGRTR
jgi:nitrate reductase molybdenum cofactor assembly chaperone NarJ/NarW